MYGHFLRRIAGCVSASLLLVGCGERLPGGPAVSAAGTALATSARPDPDEPPAKRAIRVLLGNADTQLSVDESCDGVGTSTADSTVGDYLSGFLAELTSGQNRIEASCDSPWPGPSKCQVLLKHADGEDEWAWGVGFTANGDLIEAGSMRCLGSG